MHYAPFFLELVIVKQNLLQGICGIPCLLFDTSRLWKIHVGHIVKFKTFGSAITPGEDMAKARQNPIPLAWISTQLQPLWRATTRHMKIQRGISCLESAKNHLFITHPSQSAGDSVSLEWLAEIRPLFLEWYTSSFEFEWHSSQRKVESNNIWAVGVLLLLGRWPWNSTQERLLSRARCKAQNGTLRIPQMAFCNELYALGWCREAALLEHENERLCKCCLLLHGKFCNGSPRTWAPEGKPCNSFRMAQSTMHTQWKKVRCHRTGKNEISVINAGKRVCERNCSYPLKPQRRWQEACCFQLFPSDTLLSSRSKEGSCTILQSMCMLRCQH